MPWADLEMVVPTGRDHASVVALVECALVELTHEAVGAVFVSRQVGRSTGTQYVGDVDETEWTSTARMRRLIRSQVGIAESMETADDSTFRKTDLQVIADALGASFKL